jgi:uncharacterized repeat protein (TIGR03803 family)
MKRSILPGFLLLVLFWLVWVRTCGAQPSLVTLHNFSALSGASTNGDGAVPTGGLVLSGGTLFGTALVGGTYGQGAVFAVNTNGTVFTNLHSFTGSNDGSEPFAGLAVSGTTLYGSVRQGGAAANGKLFAMDTSGSNFLTIYSFSPSVFVLSNFTSTNSDGAAPWGNLIVVGDMLYGTATGGGVFGQGTVFGLNTNTQVFTNLHNFASLVGSSTNLEGANPDGGVVFSGGRLYGTTYHGGKFGQGSVFAVSTNGSGFTNLHSFGGSINNDGANAEAGLVLVGDRLYGTTSFGGDINQGSLFAVTTDGTGYTNFHSFPAQSAGTNYDGSLPLGGLLYFGGKLFGTASGGGSAGQGTIFSVNPDGSAFTVLYNFTAGDPDTGTNTDGAEPYDGVIVSGNTLYGTANAGGDYNDGTVFALALTAPLPSLGIAELGNQTVLSWPGTASGYTLQFTTNVALANWGDISSGIGISGTNFVYTNLIDAPAAFFRLKQ